MRTRSSPALRLTRLSIALVVAVAAIAASARAQSAATPWGVGAASGAEVVPHRHR